MHDLSYIAKRLYHTPTDVVSGIRFFSIEAMGTCGLCSSSRFDKCRVTR